MKRTSSPGPRAAAQRGFTLVELLVAVTIGMALTLAITLMLTRHEAGRRSLTNVNDSAMSGVYASYVLDRTVRSAGSGFAQAWRSGVGCRLLVSRGGAQILPRGNDFPAPFATVPRTQFLAPVVVYAGAGAGGPDVLAVFTGNSALAETPLRVLPASALANGVRVPATVGLRERDLVLVMEDGTQCMLQQVVDGFAGGADQQLNFGGAYAAATVAGIDLANLGDDFTAWVAPLGNLNGNQPAFQLFGVGDNATLVSHDMLRLDGNDTVVPIAEGVADMRALYGVDSNDDGRIDEWRDPAVAPFDAATLQGGTPAARLSLGRILAVRVGMVLRGSAPEREAVSPASLTLFTDLDAALQRTRNLDATEQRYRWRTFEFTVPLRNVMLSPRS
jgi:type IV pilus assembly protein PilW